MHLSGFDVLLMVAVPLAICAVALATWWVGMSRYRRAAAARQFGLVSAASAPSAQPVVVEPAQPAPAPLTAGGSSESALVLTP
jgi:flagellar basal body-associated protein FliL